jgi:hypothetical protein
MIFNFIYGIIIFNTNLTFSLKEHNECKKWTNNFLNFNVQSLRTATLNEWSIWSLTLYPGLFFHDQQFRTDPNDGMPMPDH